MLADIRDDLIITTPQDLSSYRRLLGDGLDFGINLSYVVQENPNGLAEAFILGKDFIGDDNVALILGDNIFYGRGFSPALRCRERKSGATVFGYAVKDPGRFGVVELDSEMRAISIEEKPLKPRSNMAVTGLYFYDNSVVEIAKSIKRSDRGELEITSINDIYLEQGSLYVEVLGRGFAWLDTGTHESLLEASHFVQTIELRQGYKIACLEEIAFSKGWLLLEEVAKAAEAMGNNSYGQYLSEIVAANG